MKIKTYLLKALLYIRNVLVIDLVISLLVALTFIFTSNFTFVVYSEWLF